MVGLTISRLAKTAGVGVETVRYYQRRGLMSVPKSGQDTIYRTYDETDARRLGFIRKAQSAGFTLEEIRQLLDADPLADRASVRELARRRLTAIVRKQAELETIRQVLETMVSDCCRTKSAPCPIIRAFSP